MDETTVHNVKGRFIPFAHEQQLSTRRLERPPTAEGRRGCWRSESRSEVEVLSGALRQSQEESEQWIDICRMRSTTLNEC